MTKRWLQRAPQWCLTIAILFGCAERSAPVVMTVGPKAVPLLEFEEAFWHHVRTDSAAHADTTDLREFARTYAERKLVEILAEKAVPELETARQDRIDEFRERAMVDTLRREEYGYAYKVSERDLKQGYELLGKRLRLRYMLVGSLPEANEVHRALQEGAIFAKVAQQRSLDEGSKAAGGDLGWITYLELDPAVRDVVFSLAPGELSRPVSWGKGYQIFLVEEEAPNPSRGSLEAERPKLEQGIRTLALRRAKEKYEDELLRKYHYRTDPAEVTWITVLLREKTVGIDRGEKILERLKNSEEGEPIRTEDTMPWSEPPVALADTGRVLATFDPPEGRVTPLLIIDQLMTHPQPTWPRFERGDDVEKLIRELVLERLEIREALARKIDQRPDVQRAVAAREMEARIRQYKRNHLRQAIQPSEEEVRAYYDAHRAQFSLPEKRRFVAVNFSDWDLALQASRALKSGQTLKDIERDLAPSDPKYAGTGTEGTPLLEYGKSPLLDDQLFKLPENGVSDPIPVGSSFTVAKVIEIVPRVEKPYEEVMESIRTQLVEERLKDYQAQILEEASREYPIRVDREVLAQARLSPSG